MFLAKANLKEEFLAQLGRCREISLPSISSHHTYLRLKNWTALSCFWAAVRVLKVPRFLRLPVFGFFFLEYNRYSPGFAPHRIGLGCRNLSTPESVRSARGCHRGFGQSLPCCASPYSAVHRWQFRGVPPRLARVVR